MNLRYLLPLLSCLLLPGLLFGHPVPRDQYDRIIVVRFKPAEKPGDVLVDIQFRLEVDPQTVVLSDMKPYQKEIDLNKINKRIDYFHEFARIYAEIYGRNFFNRINGKELIWTCTKRLATFDDEKGMPLDHLRCDFEYQATFTPQSEENQFYLKDLNYQDHPGKINLSFINESAVKLTKVTAPDAKLLEKPFEQRDPDDETAIRVLRLKFMPSVGGETRVVEVPPSTETDATQATPTAPASIRDGEGHFSLLRLFLNSDYGLLLMLIIAAGVGAIHALTPGHGKTMVAAYLVGERGTVWHAVFLGIVTTLTHTGVVLIIAAALQFVPENSSQSVRESIQTGLGLVMGLAIVGLGLFLLLQRLAGRADHFHIGGGHHHHHGHHHHGHHHHGHHHHGHDHHHHGPGHHHHHHDHSHEQESVGRGRFTWWGLTVLGITGGLIPCWDAIALLVLAVGMNLFWLALPVLLAFSAGLAAVLVLIGIAVVKFRNLLGSRWGEGKIIRALPIVSAVVVTLMGFWICYEAVNSSGL